MVSASNSLGKQNVQQSHPCSITEDTGIAEMGTVAIDFLN
jgi:hypothetical protein